MANHQILAETEGKVAPKVQPLILFWGIFPFISKALEKYFRYLRSNRTFSTLTYSTKSRFTPLFAAVAGCRYNLSGHRIQSGNTCESISLFICPIRSSVWLLK